MTDEPSLENPYLTVPEVAKIFAVKNATVTLWLRDGRIEGHKLPDSGRWRILKSEVQRFAQQMYGEN